MPAQAKRGMNKNINLHFQYKLVIGTFYSNIIPITLCAVQVCEDKEIKVPKLVCGEVKEADAEDI